MVGGLDSRPASQVKKSYDVTMLLSNADHERRRYTMSSFFSENNITIQQVTEAANAHFLESLGGEEFLRRMQQYYNDHESIRKIAEWDGVSPSAVRKRIAKTRSILKKHGLFPRSWEKIDRKTGSRFRRNASIRPRKK